MSASPEALCSMQSISYCGLSQLFLYINLTAGCSTKAVGGFHKLMEKFKNHSSHNQHALM